MRVEWADDVLARRTLYSPLISSIKIQPFRQYPQHYENFEIFLKLIFMTVCGYRKFIPSNQHYLVAYDIPRGEYFITNYKFCQE